MRYATIQPRTSAGPIAVVACDDGTWIDLAAVLNHPAPSLEAELPWLTANEKDVARAVAAGKGRRFKDGEFTFLPPVVRPPAFRDFYAFEQHVKAARKQRGQEVPPAWYGFPVFYFSNHNALIGHEEAVFAPTGCSELDYELELGIVIGRGGKSIPLDRAWDHVAGFTIINDLSARDLQRAEMTVGLGPAKAKDFATAVGPWLVSRGEMADRIAGEKLTLEMTARVNGRELSRGNVSALYHSIPRLIAHASRDTELFPGDLLGSGTVGTGCILELGPETTGGWLKPADIVELEIERLGVLRTRIVERPGFN
jgi:2-keto-4-pentenoate hydratase/2-oxohepta-3-ene-1,7-dioic acid hydratase in catechol pathway